MTSKQEYRRAYWRKEKAKLRTDPAYREKMRTYMHSYVRTPEYKARRAARKLANWQHQLFVAVRSNAKRRGISFNIAESDVPWTNTCPVFGVPIGPRATRKPMDDSASLDRVDNSRGYEVGNVVVVSYRANRIKNDASLEDLRRILAFYEGIAE